MANGLSFFDRLRAMGVDVTNGLSKYAGQYKNLEIDPTATLPRHIRTSEDIAKLPWQLPTGHAEWPGMMAAIQRAALAQKKKRALPAPTPTRTTSAAPAPGAGQAASSAAARALSQGLLGIKGIEAPDLTFINPGKFARSTAAEQYDPQIQSLVASMKAGKTHGASNQKDITKWFAGVEDLYKQAAASQRMASAASENRLGNTFEGLVDTLGPEAGKSVAALSAVLAKEQSGLAGNQQSFLTSMRPISGLQGAETHVQEQRYQDQLAAAAQSKLGGLKAAKGSAFTRALGEGNETLNRQKVAQFNAAVTAATLPYQLQGQALNNAGTAQGIVTNAALLPSKLEEAQRLAAQAAKGGELDLDNATQRGQLVAAMQKGMGLNANGVLTVGPKKAYANALGVLSFAGVEGDPEAHAMAKEVLKMALRNSNARGKWKGWTLKNGQIVKK
jgi:hypothetical protein